MLCDDDDEDTPILPIEEQILTILYPSIVPSPEPTS